MPEKFKIAIFASGSGTNAENLVNYFKNNAEIAVSVTLTNNPQAGVIQRMHNLNIPVFVFNREQFYRQNYVLDLLTEYQAGFIVLAGFLWKIPENILSVFHERIVNIHPALLPKYGGKGMYGHYVHQAVLNAGEKQTGISIHYVNENYDDGAIIFQKSIDIEAENETLNSVAEKVHALEYAYFPKIVEQLIKEKYL